jgi:hypothetical protein
VSIADVDLGGERMVKTVDLQVRDLRLTVVLPSYFMFIPEQHHHLHIGSSDEDVVYVPPFEIPDNTFDWRLPVEVRGEGEAELHLEGQVFFCPVSEATRCIWATIDDRFSVRVEPGGSGSLELVHDIDILECMEQTAAGRTVATAVPDEN